MLNKKLSLAIPAILLGATTTFAAPSLSLGHDPLRGNLSLALQLPKPATQIALGLNGASYTQADGMRVSFSLGATHFFKPDQGLMLIGGIAPSVGYDPEVLLGAGLGWRWKFGSLHLDAGAWGGALVSSNGVHLPPAMTLKGNSDGVRASGMAPLFLSAGWTF